MDYSLCQAIQNCKLGEIKKIIHLYDINCQYHVHLAERVEKGTFLNIPSHHEIYHGIGLMHIGGHVSTCFARFSPSFIPGAGRIDGEILESLWSVLNEVSPSTQNASHASRREMLDEHMNDSNWKKILGTGIYAYHISFPQAQFFAVVQICRRHVAAKSGLLNASQDLAALAKTISADNQLKWNEMEHVAQEDRRDDIESMDVYDSALKLRKLDAQPM